jgi:hypothetical protein
MRANVLFTLVGIAGVTTLVSQIVVGFLHFKREQDEKHRPRASSEVYVLDDVSSNDHEHAGA